MTQNIPDASKEDNGGWRVFIIGLYVEYYVHM